MKLKKDENWEFRAFLKGYGIPLEEIDAIVHELFDYVSSEIDCTKCANCCKEVSPLLKENDIKKLCENIGMPIAVYGYSSNIGANFSAGYVSTVTHGGGPGGWDFAIDAQMAPGSSGAAIMSGDTGAIIGILVEGIGHPRAGDFLIGVQAVTDLDVCGES